MSTADADIDMDTIEMAFFISSLGGVEETRIDYPLSTTGPASAPSTPMTSPGSAVSTPVPSVALRPPSEEACKCRTAGCRTTGGNCHCIADGTACTSECSCGDQCKGASLLSRRVSTTTARSATTAEAYNFRVVPSGEGTPRTEIAFTGRTAGPTDEIINKYSNGITPRQAFMEVIGQSHLETLLQMANERRDARVQYRQARVAGSTPDGDGEEQADAGSVEEGEAREAEETDDEGSVTRGEESEEEEETPPPPRKRGRPRTTQDDEKHKRSRQKYADRWRVPFTMQEFLAFLAILLMMGLNTQTPMSSYWMSIGDVTRGGGSAFIQARMSQDRWEEMFRCLDLRNDEEFFASSRERMRSIWNPSQDVSVDESIAPTQHRRNPHHVFIARKPHRHGKIS